MVLSKKSTFFPEVKKYHTFPSRTVVKTPFQQKKNKIGGIVAYAKNTNRWLLVRPKYSFEFKAILKGSYRTSELDYYLQRISKKELYQLHTLTKNSFEFNNLYHTIFPDATVDQIVYSKERFFSSGSFFLEKEKVEKKQTEWIFPCELVQPSTNTQQSQNESMDIFIKYTGIVKPVYCYLSKQPIFEFPPQPSPYEYHFWLLIFEKEIKLPPLYVQGEISSERLWMTKSEASHNLGSIMKNMLLEMEECVQQIKI